MADPMVFVPPPPRKPRRGGIKAVVGEFVHLERLGAAANINYLSEGCSFPSLAPGLCWGADIPDGDKVAEGLPTETGIVPIFGQYTGVECFMGVGTTQDYSERAERLLQATEEHEVEAHLVGWANAGTAAGTGVGIKNAVAVAEEWADQKYNSLPVLIMSRSNAVLAGAEPVAFGDGLGVLWTINGTPILATWTAPNDKIYAVGWPTVYASDITTTVTRMLTQNTEMAIAERLYGLAVDCEFRAVVTVTASTT